MVRPWKAPVVATTSDRPVRRATWNAVSFASAPESVNTTRPGPVRASSSSPSSTVGSATSRLDTWPSVAACLDTAFTTAGWACPSTFVAAPPIRSRYSRPASSVTTAPLPLTSARPGVP